MASEPSFNVPRPPEPEQFKTLKDYTPSNTNPGSNLDPNVIVPPTVPLAQAAYDPAVHDYGNAAQRRPSYPAIPAIPVSRKWFTVTPGTSPSTVNVEPGSIYVTPTHALPSAANGGLLAHPLTRLSSAAVSGLATATGHYICVRLDWALHGGKTGWAMLVDGEGAQGNATQVGSSVPLVASQSYIQQNHVTATSIISTAAPAMTTDSLSEIILAEVTVTDGVVTVIQRHDGALTIPAPFFTGLTNMGD